MRAQTPGERGGDKYSCNPSARRDKKHRFPGVRDGGVIFSAGRDKGTNRVQSERRNKCAISQRNGKMRAEIFKETRSASERETEEGRWRESERKRESERRGEGKSEKERGKGRYRESERRREREKERE